MSQLSMQTRCDRRRIIKNNDLLSNGNAIVRMEKGEHSRSYSHRLFVEFQLLRSEAIGCSLASIPRGMDGRISTLAAVFVYDGD